MRLRERGREHPRRRGADATDAPAPARRSHPSPAQAQGHGPELLLVRQQPNPGDEVRGHQDRSLPSHQKSPVQLQSRGLRARTQGPHTQATTLPPGPATTAAAPSAERQRGTHERQVHGVPANVVQEFFERGRQVSQRRLEVSGVLVDVFGDACGGREGVQEFLDFREEQREEGGGDGVEEQREPAQQGRGVDERGGQEGSVREHWTGAETAVALEFTAAFEFVFSDESRGQRSEDHDTESALAALP